ncbi:2-(3-amino-3-carboxypropyl)histidine synthase subunit 2-like isoform X2 [Acipenser ruthenus]|uniref:2-(3-amino-3-carboxypropyl)histidine synthase subunit 2-like isoform X2 n=1 Tax=Acipenser ruthenus TaxID=7906 RepID=UPI002740A092|nr:2-(3-amino-3-carboxypropyl)histidine synthase subunit 2-like isoform X2 [Acipenser ruthenus]
MLHTEAGVTMTTAFSSDGAQAIQRTLGTLATVGSAGVEALDEVYRIEETCTFILQNELHKVALQFSDDLLVDSAAVAAKLEKNTGAKMYILGDTSYGSCCVDEVAAEHVGAEGIIHYGRACLSPSRRLPVMHVFGRKAVDLERCAESFREHYPDTQSHVIILYDVVYFFIMGNLQHILESEYANVVMSQISTDGTQCYSPRQTDKPHEAAQAETNPNQTDAQFVRKFGRQFALREGCSLEDYRIFYIGQEGVTLTNFMMTFNQCSFYTFDPETSAGRLESVNINKALMKRYYLIERAKDSKVVGILVGTLGVADYLSIIDHLKDLIKKAGKKSYVFVMGKLNVPKLANFLEIDIYVLVACPENSFLDCSEFYRPVVTPFEMEVACNKNREWTGEYVTSFRDLLPGACSHVEFPNPGADGDDTDVSLITGALRSSYWNNSESQDNLPSSSLVQRNPTLTVAQTNPAASFLASRSWQGLEQKLGETPVTKAVEGRRGIAIAYEEEGNS